MSILRDLFDNEWLQRHDIERIHERVVQQSATGRLHLIRLRERVAQLENDNAELALLARSLYVYLKRRGDFDASLFAAVIKEIDAQDGVVDGKVTKPKPPSKIPLVPRRRR